jgi:hypothetical protein
MSQNPATTVASQRPRATVDLSHQRYEEYGASDGDRSACDGGARGRSGSPRAGRIAHAAVSRRLRHLRRGVRGFSRGKTDPALPVRLRGDPDDLGTAALAEFLAPAVIISANSVFTRFGLANSVAGTWLPLAYRLLQVAGYEATLTEAAYALELAARLVAVPVSAVADTARRHPPAALGIGAAIALVAYQAGYLRRDRLRAAGQEIRSMAATGIEALGNATDAYGKARQALQVIEPYGTPTVEELAARHLARVRRPLPLDDLAAALEAAGHAVSTAELRDATSRHPAFRTTASQPALIGIGRIARPSPVAIVSPGHPQRR